MKAIIVGLGSMGRRRARLLHQFDHTIPIFGIDMQEARRKQAELELGIQTFGSIKEACMKYAPDIAFVSTPPLSHPSIIRECLNQHLHVFTELNLYDIGYNENMELADSNGLVLFLSSTFLYRREIQYIKDAVDNCGCRLSYTYHAGQYLPDWHPWESYQDFFVGKKETNGCREFMAVEFPWLTDVFGQVKAVHSICSRDSSLQIDFPDTYQIIFEHESGHKGMACIDVVSRKAVRRFELSGEHLYLTWNGTPDSLFRYNFETKEELPVSLYSTVDRREGYSPFIIEDAYTSEIVNFLNVVKGEEHPRYSFEKDKIVLSIIDKIEKVREKQK